MRGHRSLFRSFGCGVVGLLTCLWFFPASAASLLGPAEERPLVFFFGGYGATEADMRVWVKAAESDPRYGSAFDFEAFAYPKDINWSTTRAVAASSETIARVVARIRTMPQRSVVVAGHSSGAAIAARIVSLLPPSRNIKLISLDTGINVEREPDPGFYPLRNLECWASDQGGLQSVGFRRIRELCKENARVFHATGCETAICLHFSLVNRRAAADMSWGKSRELSDEGVTRGYADLMLNLGWLDRSRGFPDEVDADDPREWTERARSGAAKRVR